MNLQSQRRRRAQAPKNTSPQTTRPLSAADAPEAHRAALRATPLRASLWNTYGAALLHRRQYPAAMRAWSCALALDPACADALGNLAALLRDMEYAAHAETALRRALRAAPAHAGLHNALVHALQGSGRTAEAQAACRRALALAPAFADAWCNAGLTAQQNGRRGEAAALFTRAVRLHPEHALARFNGALLALENGRLNAGWPDYAARFAAGQARPWRRFTAPEWRGEPLRGKTLFIWREQGVGDEILFASCYADAVKAAGAVVIECEPRLASLFARSFPQATVRAAQRVEPGVTERVLADYHLPAGSAPGLLRRALGDFPPRARWLFPDENLVAAWRRRLDTLPPGLRVGFAWRSALTTLNRRGAYAPLAQWRPVLTAPDVSFINLQHGGLEPGGVLEELAAAEQAFGVRVVSAPRLNLKDDFENVAALIASLDLVIAPAVSVAELSGALGTPTWRFGARDWTELGAAVRPWAPAMRCFQPAPGGDLGDALTQIGAALRGVAKAG